MRTCILCVISASMLNGVIGCAPQAGPPSAGTAGMTSTSAGTPALTGVHQRQAEVNAKLKAMNVDGGAIVQEPGDVTGVFINSGPIPDEFVTFVLEQPKLRELGTSDGALTDQHFARLTGLKDRLETLQLENPELTDEGLKHIGELTRLKKLELPSQVTDAGVVHLATLVNLEELALVDAKVTDESVPTIKGFTKLTKLNLVGTDISRTGVEELVAALPECRIVTPEGPVAGKP